MASIETVLAIVSLILTGYHLPFIDREPQVDVSWAGEGSSGPRSGHHRPVTGFIWLGVSPAPPRKPPVVLGQSQHDGVPRVSNLGWGRDRGPGQAGFVNTGSLDRHSAPQTTLIFPFLNVYALTCHPETKWSRLLSWTTASKHLYFKIHHSTLNRD